MNLHRERECPISCRCVTSYSSIAVLFSSALLLVSSMTSSAVEQNEILRASNVKSQGVSSGRPKRPLESSNSTTWGPWSNWSLCSRTCGIGVTSRTRQCVPGFDYVSSAKQDLLMTIKPSCIGVYREYKTCNSQPCSKFSLEFRRAQCEAYNGKEFHGKRYDWLPYYKGANKCELTCRPKGRRFFVQLASEVIDGTRCHPNDPYNICIGGKCELVGCDGILGSPKILDRCGVCGGNDSTCHVISGIFTRTRLPVGYNRVTSVPRGACNINVTELVVSPNYLAIRLTGGPYIVNGDRDAIGVSGEFVGAGTVFSYQRAAPLGREQEADLDQPAVETILAPGPLSSGIDIMVVQDHENRGIMYTYMIPTNMDVEVASSKQGQGHGHGEGHHGVRHQHQHRSSHHRHGATLVSDSLNSRVVSAADQSVNDVNDDETLADDSELGARRLQSHEDKEQEEMTSTHDNYQGETPSRRQRKKHRRNQRTQTTSQPVDQSDDPRVTQAERTVDTEEPVVAGDGVRQSTRAGNRRPTHQVGINFGLADRPRYVPSGQSFGVQSHSYPAAGWPYSGQQILPSYHQSAAGAGQQQYPGVGQQYHAIGAPYVQQQPYYLPPVQQTAALAQSQYDYYGPAAGSTRQRRRNNHQGSLLNDQWPLGGSTGGPDFDEEQDGDEVDDYVWKIAGFSECSQSCGGGFQQTQVVCMKVTGTQVVVTDENCEPSLKPTVRTVTCSNTPCPPSWESTEWSECSTTCNRGQQTRSTECRQRVSPTLSIAVSASRCSNLQRPNTFRACNDDRPCTRWKIGEWSQCSTECGRGQRTREVICVNVEDKLIAENKCEGSKPRMTEFCDMGSCARTWFFTNWSSECSSDCGEGVYRREVHCSADPQRCSEINRPKSEKPCKHERPCGGRWFTGPWSKCSVTCGEGVLLRDAICVKKLGAIMAVVGDENCQQDEKPETEQDCEMEPCEPEWYTTEWSECSRSCDTGLQNREAKCLDADQLPSQSCDAVSKPTLRQTCNVHPCTSSVVASLSSINGSVSQSVLKDSARGRNHRNQQSRPQSASCQDKFKNCRVVVQARLCRYAYYKEVCCFSCISHGYEPIEPASISQEE